jgi:hypothetical protein
MAKGKVPIYVWKNNKWVYEEGPFYPKSEAYETIAKWVRDGWTGVPDVRKF